VTANPRADGEREAVGRAGASIPLIALVGTGRSGTTLLSRLVDGQSQIYCHPVEINSLEIIGRLLTYGRIRFLGQVPSDCDFSRPVDAVLLCDAFTHQEEELRNTILARIQSPPDFSGSWRAALTVHGEVCARHFLPDFLASFAADLGYSSPKAILFKFCDIGMLPVYEQLFPEMRFVHLLRDPVKAWASMKRTSLSAGKQSWHHAGDSFTHFVRDRLAQHFRYLNERKSSERHYILRYEDLVRAPEDGVDGIFSWLGMAPPPYPGLQTSLGRRFQVIPDNASQGGVRLPEGVVPDTAATYGYSDVVTPREKAVIVRVCGRDAAAFGYDLEVGAVGAGESSVARLKLLLRWLPPDPQEFSGARSLRDWLLVARSLVLRRRFVLSACLDRKPV